MIRTISLVCSLCLVGCSTPADKAARHEVDTASIYTRSSVRFSDAVLFKPTEPATPDLLFNLAPLIILQVSETNLLPQLADGLLSSAGSGTNQRPRVHAWADTVQIQGRAHARFNYVWDHDPAVKVKTAANQRQGVSITLGSNGQPMIWEVLEDTSGLAIIVVSESLEQRAVAEFGLPLPGRRFSVEAATNASPETLVMRVIDDGPVVMGPIVYLSKGTRDVATIICRCMPAQAGHLVDTRVYDLLPLPGPSGAWPKASLDTRLRLPEF
jgi:hypothetical protein